MSMSHDSGMPVSAPCPDSGELRARSAFPPVARDSHGAITPGTCPGATADSWKGAGHGITVMAASAPRARAGSEVSAGASHPRRAACSGAPHFSPPWQCPRSPVWGTELRWGQAACQYQQEL